MGILNLTPDSFYDGGKFASEKDVLNRVEKMLNEGADIIDIGGMSSRPGAEMIGEQVELKRMLPHLKRIIYRFPEVIISIDTIRAKIAEESLNLGALIVNDISGGRFDEQMIPLIAKRKIPYIIMHMKGMPADMQHNPVYENVVTEVMDFFVERISTCRKAGVIDLVIDVGFGFGKTIEHNYTLLRNLKYFKHLNLPVLAGTSRKGMIYKSLNITTEEALNGTTVVNTIALMNGANILRVHDVKEAKEAVRIFSLTYRK